jgi:glycosyltransferase involved in cell wall biosynthesis
VNTAPHDQPLLSVITPAYNAEEFIGETLDSVASLGVPHEHVVVDDGSTDNTPRLLAARDDPSLTWFTQENRGQAGAVNAGLERARGDLLAWLNADDTYVVENVRRAIELLATEPKLDAVYGYMDIVDQDGELVRQARCGPFNWHRYRLVGDYWPTPTIIFRRRLLTQAPQLDERYVDTSDTDFYIRLLRDAEVRRIRHSIVRFRYHATSKTGSNADEMFAEARSIRLRLARNPVERAIVRGTARLRLARERVLPFWPRASSES